MTELTIKTTFSVFEDITETPKNIQSLMQNAVESRKKAYAPYSKFKVGVALVLENGTIVIGSNQENAAYPSGLCAERVAIYHAGAMYPDQKIISIAITATSDNFESVTPIPPCGSCRQSISEFEVKQKQPIEIYFMGASGKVFKSDSLANLLPLSFSGDYL